jgi:hypothetical protein
MSTEELEERTEERSPQHALTEVRFRYVGEDEHGREQWETTATRADGLVTSFTGEFAYGVEFSTRRDPVEVPSSTGWREFEPGPVMVVSMTASYCNPDVHRVDTTP